jgi:hypothetical protein
MSLSGNISFFATVVKDKATFWVKLHSPELYKRVSAIYEIRGQRMGGGRWGKALLLCLQFLGNADLRGRPSLKAALETTEN